MPKTRRNPGPPQGNGLTLLEVLVTISIVAMIAGPLLTLFTTSRSNLLEEKKYMQAVFLSQRVLEEALFSYDTGSDHPSNGAHLPDTSPYDNGLSCTLSTASLDNGLYRITVNVSFEHRRMKRSVKLTTIYACNPREGVDFLPW